MIRIYSRPLSTHDLNWCYGHKWQAHSRRRFVLIYREAWGTSFVLFVFGVGQVYLEHK